MFMHINHPATLTLDDHAVLERLMCTLSGSPKPVASLLRRKLETAVILHPGAATDDLVTSGRRVRYWVNGELEADHYLTWEHPKVGDASAISLQSPLGLALLGLRTGQSISFPSEAGIETAEVTGVNSQACMWVFVESHRASAKRLPINDWRTPYGWVVSGTCRG